MGIITVMSPEDFAEKMRKIAAIKDYQERHSKVDELLCEVLIDLGYGVGVREVFEEWSA